MDISVSCPHPQKFIRLSHWPCCLTKFTVYQKSHYRDVNFFRQVNTEMMNTKLLQYLFSSPIGIAMGTIVFAFSKESATMDVAIAILGSISTGTFLFVVFIELIPKELNLDADGEIKQLIYVIFGFTLMAGMQALSPISD